MYYLKKGKFYLLLILFLLEVMMELSASSESKLPFTSDYELSLLNDSAPHRLRYLKLNDLEGRTRFSFLDTRQVMDMKGVVQEVHSAEIYPEPVLVGDQPWEKIGVTLYGSVIYDGKKFRMWYEPAPGAFTKYPFWSVGYAESKDGIHWRKPNLGIVKSVDGSLKNNLTSLFGHSPSVIDLGPKAESEKRYRAVSAGTYMVKAGSQGVYKPRWPKDEKGRKIHGYYTHYSSDGFNWHYYKRTPSLPYMSDTAYFVYDKPRQRFLGMVKLEPRVGFRDRRSVCITTSKDFIHWENPRIVLIPDEEDDRIAREKGFAFAEFYGMGLFPTRDFIVGILEVFYTTKGLFPSQDPGMRLGYRGKIEIQLTYSYDGYLWRRVPGRKTFIPWGRKGEWNDGGVYGRTSEVEVRDEVFIYFSGYKGDHASSHDCAIGLAKIKRDRWASLSATGKGFVDVYHGKIAGKELYLNAKARGSIRVEVLQGLRNPEVIQGFERESCIPFKGDEIRYPVQWKKRKIAELVGKDNIILKFYLEDAELFSFVFK